MFFIFQFIKYLLIFNYYKSISDALKEHKEKCKPDDLSKFSLKFQGLSTFRNQVVYVDLLKDENYKYLASLQSKLFHKQNGY